MNEHQIKETEHAIMLDDNKLRFILPHGDNTSSHPNYKFTLWMRKCELNQSSKSTEHNNKTIVVTKRLKQKN